MQKNDSCEPAGYPRERMCAYTGDFCARRNEFPQRAAFKAASLGPITIGESLTREFNLAIISNVPVRIFTRKQIERCTVESLGVSIQLRGFETNIS